MLGQLDDLLVERRNTLTSRAEGVSPTLQYGLEGVEIGTADESSWTPFLPEVSQGQAGQENFVRELLQRCGFSNVRVIAESAAYHREVQRLLFIAEPARRASQDTLESLQVA